MIIPNLNFRITMKCINSNKLLSYLPDSVVQCFWLDAAVQGYQPQQLPLSADNVCKLIEKF